VSKFSQFCDAVLVDLEENVPGMRGVLPHRYMPWDPEKLVADGGERHLAVWPAAEATDESQPQTTDGGAMLVQLYRILYWEDAGDESPRGIGDQGAAADLLELIEAVRARFYLRSNFFIGGTEYTTYVGTSLPDRSSTVRWFQISVRARYSITPT